MDKTRPRSAKEIITPLVLLALACAVLLYISNKLTQEKITANARALQLGIINSVMPLPHNNQLYDDFIEVFDPAYFRNAGSVLVFRARMEDQPVGAAFMPVIAKGYNSNIHLLIGVAFDGTLLAVRTIKHNETEGLGDQVNHNKSDWINRFTGLSLDNTPLENWSVKSDGGNFDQLSGATITSRGVINAVRKSLEYYKLNRERLY
jgi:electron transport complex protein RnfG